MKKIIDITIEGATILFILFSMIIFTNIIETTMILFYILLTIHRCIFFIILFLWLLKLLIYKKEKLIRKTFLDLPLILLILISIISIKSSVYKRVSQECVFNIGIYVILCFLIIHNFDNSKQLKRILIAILLPLITLGFYGVTKFVKTVEFDTFIKNPIFHRKITTLFINQPNAFGSFMSMGILITLGFILDSKEKISKLLFGIFIIILSTCLILCFSMSSYLQTFVSVLLLGILIKKIKINKLFILVLSILAILFLSRIVFLPLATKESSLERLFIWNTTSQMIKDKPLTGFGLGTFNSIYPWYYIEHPDHERHLILPGHAHNSLLHLWSDGGIFFVFSIIWIVVLVIINVFRLHRRYTFPENEIIPIITFCIIIGFISHNLFQHQFDFIHPVGMCFNIILWSCLGITASYINMKNNTHNYYNRKVGIILLLVLIIIYSLVTIKSHTAKFYFNKGVYYENKGNYTTAIKIYKKLIKIEPNVVIYRLNLGNCYYRIAFTFKSKKLTDSYINQAIKEYEKVIQLTPYNISPYRKLAYIYYSLGKPYLAYKYYKKVERFEKYIDRLKGWY